MEYIILFIIIVLIITFLLRKNLTQANSDEDPELFSTEKFKDKDKIKAAKCPQCGKIANTYKDVEKYFGLRRVGYATDIQSWCRVSRQNRVEIKSNDSNQDDLNLFDE